MKTLCFRSRNDIWGAQFLVAFKTLMYLVTLVLGMLVAYSFFSQNLMSIVKELSVWKLLASAYNRIGVVSLGLFPLTAVLLTVILRDALHFRGYRVHPVSSKWYHLILFAAPNLGLLGTFISLGNALAGMDVSQGLQFALNSLSADISQALDSTKYGICLAILAYCFLLFLNKDDDEKEDEKLIDGDRAGDTRKSGSGLPVPEANFDYLNSETKPDVATVEDAAASMRPWVKVHRRKEENSQ